MKDHYESLIGREEAAKDIYELIHAGTCPDILLLGKHGSGKRFVISLLAGYIEHGDHISLLTFVGDQIVEEGEKYSARTSEFGFNASIYLGISWSTAEKNNSKVDYILNCLRNAHKKHLVFIISDPGIQSSEIRDLIHVILQNKAFIEAQLDKKLTFIALAEKDEVIDYPNFAIIELCPYSMLDIQEYVQRVLKFELDDEESNEKFRKLHEICDSDFDLVNLIYRDVLENNLNYSRSLNELVKRRLNFLKKASVQRSISSKDVEEIILTCSLSAEFFSRIEISKTTHRSEEIVNDSFQLFIEEVIFNQKGVDLFDFVSPEIKQVLEKVMLERHNTRLLDFYNYLTEYRTDEYYLRAYYLIKYETCISENSFCLLILATSQAFMFNDKWIKEKINSLLLMYGSPEDLEIYECISEAYNKHKSGDYLGSLQSLKNVPQYCLGTVGRTELSRLTFKNYYLMHDTDSFAFRKVCHGLKDAAINPPMLSQIEGMLGVEEKIFNLRLIYDLAPYVLDTENNYDLFQTLFDRSNIILRQEHSRNFRAKTIEYIKNIFNRKAFLFANPMQSMTYYEEAGNFFRKNHIWGEYCMTLIGQAGTCLACHEYKQAESLCQEAQETVDAKHVILEKPEKLQNNLRIAQFLYLEEQTADEERIKKSAEETACFLEQLSDGPACGTKHVLLTNAASLYLYANRIADYHRVKLALENSLGCPDISELENENINDFYRYHFAWFELYYNMTKRNWAFCRRLFAQLDPFIPSLFKRQENLWKQKNDAVRQLIDDKKVISSREFCLNLVHNSHREQGLAKFYHRGLMVSDIQYTSFD